MSRDLENDLERAREENLLSAYQKIFRTKEGKAVLADLMRQSMVFQSTFTGNSQTYFNEGRRRVGLYILALLECRDYESFRNARYKMTAEEAYEYPD